MSYIPRWQQVSGYLMRSGLWERILYLYLVVYNPEYNQSGRQCIQMTTLYRSTASATSAGLPRIFWCSFAIAKSKIDDEIASCLPGCPGPIARVSLAACGRHARACIPAALATHPRPPSTPPLTFVPSSRLSYCQGDTFLALRPCPRVLSGHERWPPWAVGAPGAPAPHREVTHTAATVARRQLMRKKG